MSLGTMNRRVSDGDYKHESIQEQPLELCSRTGGVPTAVCGPVVLHLATDRYFSSRLVIWLRDHGTDRFSNARPHPRRRTTKRNRRTTGHHLVSRFYGRIYGVTYLPVFVSVEL